MAFQFVISRCDGSEMFQSRKYIFNEVAIFIETPIHSVVRMDCFYRILILFVTLSSSAYAALPPARVTGPISRSGVQTTYTVEGVSRDAYIVNSSAGSGTSAISTSVCTNGSAYVRDVNIPVGETIAAARVINGITMLR